MTKLFLIIAILSIAINLSANTIKNSDTPSIGQWDLKATELWRVNEAGDLPVLDISDLQVSKDGQIYLLSSKYYKVSIFSPEGKFISNFGKKGEGPGEFKFCFDLTIVDDTIILPDSNRLHYFDLKGNFQKTATIQNNTFAKTFIDSSKFLYTRKNEKTGVEKAFIYKIRGNSSKELFVIPSPKIMEAQTKKIHLVIQIPSLNPAFICAVKNGRIYHATSDIYRITGRDMEGKELMNFSITDRQKIKVTQKFKESYFSGNRFSLNGRKPPKNLLKQLTASIPDEASYFRNIFITESGYFVITKNDIYKKNSIKYDIFSPEGKFLYTSDFKTPEGCELKGFWNTDKELFTFIEDEDGEYSLIKYKINLP